MGFFRHTKKDTTVCVVDIGSASIGVALVTLRHNDAPLVHDTYRESFLVSNDTTGFVALSRAMYTTLTNVLNIFATREAYKKYGGDIDNAYITFSSPWYMSQTKLVKYGGTDSFSVSKEIIETALEKEVERFSHELYDRKKTKNSDVGEIIDRSIIDIRLNGYSVDDVIAQTVQSMELKIFFSAVSKEVHTKVLRILEDVYGIRDGEVHSLPLVLFTVAEGLIATDDIFTILDVTGDVTDASIIKHGVLVETVSFPLGKDNVILEVAKVFAVSPAQATSLLTLYGLGKSDVATTIKIESVLDTVLTEARRIGEHVCNDLWTTRIVPKQAFIIADSELTSWMNEYKKKKNMPVQCITWHTLEFHILGEKVLAPFVDNAPKIKRDAFLSIQAIFANILTLR